MRGIIYITISLVSVFLSGCDNYGIGIGAASNTPGDSHSANKEVAGSEGDITGDNADVTPSPSPTHGNDTDEMPAVPEDPVTDSGDGNESGDNSSDDRDAGDIADRMPIVLRIEAEDYVSYLDSTDGNEGGEYRDEDVDIEATIDDGEAGYSVGWMDASELLTYDVTLPVGVYVLDLRVAAKLEVDAIPPEFSVTIANTPLASIEIPNTGEWDAWQTVTSAQFEILDHGDFQIELNVVAAGANLNWLEIREQQP